MFYKQLEPFLNQSDFITQFQKLLLENDPGILIHELNRSSKSVITSYAFKTTGKNILFICSDDRQAEDYLDDYQILVGSENVSFLPDFEVLPYEERSPHYNIRAQRIETLARVASRKPQIYTLSIRALIRKMVNFETFKSNIISLKKNQEYSPDLLVSNLVGMGYNHEYQVAKVGDFARRGGIVDIFSPNFSYPVRIDFFGDDIESIRPFYLQTQRSMGQEKEEIEILPSREFSIHNIDTNETLWEKIHEKGFYEGIELDISMLLNKTETFLNYFAPENCLVIFDEFQYFKSTLEEIEDETKDLWVKAKKEAVRRFLPDPHKIFASKNEINKQIKIFNHIYLSNNYQEIKTANSRLEAPVTAQTVMHSDLNLLEESIRDKLNNGFKIFIQSDNKSQSKRMRDLLPDYVDQLHFTIGVFQKGFNLNDGKVSVFTDHEIFSRYKRRKYSAKFSQDDALIDYESLEPGDYIVHIDHGIGIYEGLKKMSIGGSQLECLSIRYADNDRIYVPTYQLRIVSRFVSDEGYVPSIHKLGGKKWESAKTRVKKQIELVADDLVKLYAERSLRKGIAFEPDNVWQTEMEESFIHEDTPDQTRATLEIKKDMEASAPMERLLCGDVGFGKTEVAIRAAFKAVMGGYQVCVLVPTTLLAEQHYLVFKERLAQYPVNIAMFSRFRSKANLKKDVAKLLTGEIDIAIGTHRLISGDIKFNKIGLLIIDEEHRFGVRHKDKLRKFRSNVDTLYMSATPIPRTLNMALSKLKEMSLIQTSPKARLPIRTVIIPYDEQVIKDAILREVDRGGQVFFVHNRVQTIDSVATDLRRLLPKVKFRVGHGQLPEKQLEEIMLDFAHHKFDVLVATTIIESGIDIPNANTMIVNRADMFGLAQLYQMRGRVGRSNRRAYAYLMIPNKLEESARKRLETLTEYNALGAGYQIAMRDLELRGTGSLLGTKQSGIINTIGFNFYNRMLEKAVKNIQEKNPGGIWADENEDPIKHLTIEADFFFPATYIHDEKTRLSLYKRMIEFTEPDEFTTLKEEMVDRFGEIPKPALATLDYYQVRMHAAKIGLLSFLIRNKIITIEFDNKKLPSHEKIGKIVQKFTYQVAFDTTGNFKLKFTLPKETTKENELTIALEILDFIESIYK